MATGAGAADRRAWSSSTASRSRRRTATSQTMRRRRRPHGRDRAAPTCTASSLGPTVEHPHSASRPPGPGSRRTPSRSATERSRARRLIALFGAGVASFLAPCIVPLVPAYLGIIVGEIGDAHDPARAVPATLVFIARLRHGVRGLGAAAGLARLVVARRSRTASARRRRASSSDGARAARRRARAARARAAAHHRGCPRCAGRPAVRRRRRVRRGVEPVRRSAARPPRSPSRPAAGEAGRGTMLLLAYAPGIGVPFLARRARPRVVARDSRSGCAGSGRRSSGSPASCSSCSACCSRPTPTPTSRRISPGSPRRSAASDGVGFTWGMIGSRRSFPCRAREKEFACDGSVRPVDHAQGPQVQGHCAAGRASRFIPRSPTSRSAAYMLAAVFDVISFVGGEDQTWAREFYRAGTFSSSAAPSSRCSPC